MNDFLSDILKVVIVLDVLGIVAYFVLGLKTRTQPNPVRVTPPQTTVLGTEKRGLFGPGFLNPAVAASQPPAATALTPSHLEAHEQAIVEARALAEPRSC